MSDELDSDEVTQVRIGLTPDDNIFLEVVDPDDGGTAHVFTMSREAAATLGASLIAASHHGEDTAVVDGKEPS